MTDAVEKRRAAQRRAWRERQRVFRAKDGWAQEERRRHLWTTYRITPAQYDQMLLDQGGLCAICGRSPKTGKYLHVDHVKDSNPAIVRGLLCQKCNMALGLMDHDTAALASAIAYLN